MKSSNLMYNVKRVCMDIHKQYGPGLLEKTYHQILKLKLEKLGYDVKSEVMCPLNVEGKVIEDAYRIDLLVNDVLIIELKAVLRLEAVHHRQLITYMTLSNKPEGLLVNFCCDDIFKEGLKSWNKDSIKRAYRSSY